MQSTKLFLAILSVLAYMIELNQRNQTLFTELKKLALVSRYVVSNVAKIGVFHTYANFQKRFLENYINRKISSQNDFEIRFCDLFSRNCL